MREGMSLPNAIKNAPDLPLGLSFYYAAYLSLRSCANEGGIPWTAINDYCKAYEVEGDQREAMFHHLSEMDECYSEHIERINKRSGTS